MKVVLLGKPVSVNQLYRGRRFLTEIGKSTKQDYFIQARQQYKGKVLLRPLKVVLTAYFRSKATSDLDNVCKATFDSLTGVLWADDRQIWEIRAFKQQDKLNPRVEVEVTELSTVAKNQ